MRWSELETRQPRLAELGRGRLLVPGVVLVATIRRDGTPRVSPVEPYLMDDDLWLSMLWQSAIAKDLTRDPRILVHNIITSRDGGDGEFKVRGRAEATNDPAVQRRYAEAVADNLGWAGARTVLSVRRRHRRGHGHPLRQRGRDQCVTRWPAGREFVRRGTSATSVGDPEPYQELLSAE